MTTDLQDSIERETLIAASQDRVWSLVTEPGFWVGPTGAEAVTGETTVAHSDQYGDYPVRVEKIDPKSYVAYRWASAYSGQGLREGITTLIEFTLTPEGDGTRLRVVESGFTALEGDEELRRGAFKDNAGGWREVMDEFKKRAEEAA
ncbi:SRPBCC domain-containing protein [Catenulispora pinisilvae]|uniref:SRPBCC domain-containing protein n=1 Tax=Catenulispora pinisilvae TaxID=2705253 RepID=UPI0018915BF7|nr:SRPBCC domain-containing protein [Catenulispora pinisilvae]